MMDDHSKQYNVEASLSTLIVVLLMFLLIFFVHLSVPDPPIDERGGGPGGQGKMMTAGLYQGTEENEPPAHHKQPQEEVQEPTPQEVPAPQPEPTPQDPIISDNTSNDVVKASDDKKKREPRKKNTEDKPKENNQALDNTPETSTKTKKPAKNVNTRDLFPDEEDGNGGSPDGNGGGNGNSSSGSSGTGGTGTEGIGTSSNHSFGENGWNWSKSPRTDKKSNKNGEIVFNVEINENGKVTNVSPQTYTVDYELMQTYQEECYKLKFVRKNDIAMSGKTRGTITFRFKAR